MTELSPPRIQHFRYKREDNWHAIVDDAAKALHMSKGERAMLHYYASSQSGFAPSLQAIANATGQNRSQVYRNRKKAMDQGILIMVYGRDNAERIMVDWERLKLFASLDPKMTSKHCYIAQPEPYGKKNRSPLSIFSLRYEPFTKILPQLAGLSERQFAALQRRIAKVKGA